MELSKLLCGAYAQDVLSEYISLFVIMIPQIPPQSDFSVFESLCGCEVRVKWACFLYPCKACADGILRALKFDNKTREYVLALLRLYDHRYKNRPHSEVQPIFMVGSGIRVPCRGSFCTSCPNRTGRDRCGLCGALPWPASDAASRPEARLLPPVFRPRREVRPWWPCSYT